MTEKLEEEKEGGYNKVSELKRDKGCPNSRVNSRVSDEIEDEGFNVHGLNEISVGRDRVTPVEVGKSSCRTFVT